MNFLNKFLLIAILTLLFTTLSFYKLQASELSNSKSIYSEDVKTYLVKFKNENIKLKNEVTGEAKSIEINEKLKSKELRKWSKVELNSYKEFSDLSLNPLVEDIQPLINYKFSSSPNDPIYASSGTYLTGQYDQWNMRNVGLKPVETPDSTTSAWEVHTGSTNTVIAVIDSGIDLAHPDLSENLWVNSVEQAGVNGVDDDENGYVDDINGYNFFGDNNNLQDEIGHGTHVSGIIAAVSNNNVGLAGVCWNCRLMPLRVFGTVNLTTDIYIAEAITYAVDNGANVINLSVSGAGYSSIMQDAINYAWVHDVLVVSAAGNENDDSSYYSPAGLNNVIAVSAVDYNDSLASFSNDGLKVDLSAPGVFVLSTKLQSITSSGCYGIQIYTCLSGTSMAAPHVSGAAALIYDYHRNDPTPWNVYKVRKALLSTPDDKGSPGFDTSFGFGRLNVNTAIRSNITLGTDMPSVSLDTPAQNIFKDVITLTGSVSATDLYIYNLSFDSLSSGGIIYKYSGRNNITNGNLINTNVGLDEGTYNITLTAEDFNGNTVDTPSVQIKVDLTPPSIFTLSSPSTNWSTNKRPSFSWSSATDSNGSVKYDLYINNSVYQANLTTTSYTPTSDIADGNHTWKVIAKDIVGNIRDSGNRSVRIDNQTPNSFTISKTINNGKAILTFSTSDALSGISHYQVSIDNGSFSNVTSPHTTAVLSDGDHTIKIRAFDNVGNYIDSITSFNINSRIYYLKSVGDLSGDGTVELSDLSILATYWNQNNDAGDINSDAMVDLSDLSILAQNWQKSF